MADPKQSPFDDLVEIVAKVPAWVGIILAVAVYAVLHPVATMDIAASATGKDIGVSVGKAMFRAAATVGQYLVPGAFLFGALLSVLSRRKLNALHAQVATAGRKAALDGMSWQEFEQLVGEYFRRQGFSVEETGGGGADGGVDLLLRRGSDHYLVQCKQWKARQVGVETVRELYGVMAAKGVAGGYVVTSGVFTDEAKRFAEGREIELIDGEQLVAVIEAQATPHPGPLPQGERESSSGLDPGSLSGKTIPNEAPTCPQCGSSMVLRTARKGSNAGSSFWDVRLIRNVEGATQRERFP